MSDMSIIQEFEDAIARYVGTRYGVSVSSCTNAIFLCIQYLKYKGEIKDGDIILLPSRTYLSVACTVKNCGLNIQFEDYGWTGMYQLEPTRIWDSAVRLTSNMIEDPNNLTCLSFQYRKTLNLGRGGMIVTNDYDAVRWLKQARFNGRHEGVSQWEDELEFCGWNMYMTPEQAARGITLFDTLEECNSDIGGSWSYPDISEQKVFQ